MFLFDSIQRFVNWSKYIVWEIAFYQLSVVKKLYQVDKIKNEWNSTGICANLLFHRTFSIDLSLEMVYRKHTELINY